MDEKNLVTLAAGGDKNAFAALYTRYRDDLYRYAYFRLGNAEDARDAVSACIVSAYEGVYALRAAGAFRAWIFRRAERAPQSRGDLGAGSGRSDGQPPFSRAAGGSRSSPPRGQRHRPAECDRRLQQPRDRLDDRSQTRHRALPPFPRTG